MEDTFIVTEEWFNSNRDCIPGLNRAQAEALGEKYPLKSGWKVRIVGKEITLDQKKAYEDSKGLTYSAKKRAIKKSKKLKTLIDQKETLELELEIAEMQLKLKKLRQKAK